MHRQALAHFKKSDPLLYAVAKKIGPFDIRKSEDIFVELCDSIVSQQLSTKAAASIFTRLKNLLNNDIIPDSILNQTDEAIQSVGLSRAKVSYIKDLADKVKKQEVLLPQLYTLDDLSVIKELTKVKGIGIWTAEMILIFTLNRPDIFSVGDYGLKKAVSRIYSIEMTELTPLQLQTISRPWSPFRSYASRVLWKSLAIDL